MTTTTNNVTVTINNQTVTADLTTIAALLNMAVETAMPEAPKAPKPEAKNQDKPAKKAHETRSKHDAILDSKRVDRMVKTAVERAASQGFEVKPSKQGKWVWLYPCGKSAGCGRSPEFKEMKLAKGWKHSMKRAAYFRDFS